MDQEDCVDILIFLCHLHCLSFYGQAELISHIYERFCVGYVVICTVRVLQCLCLQLKPIKVNYTNMYYINVDEVVTSSKLEVSHIHL